MELHGELNSSQGNLDDHMNDATDAHDASAISVADAADQFVGTNVETVLAEVQDNLDAHLADATDAHDASAISYVGGTGMSATDVEAAVDELANEKANTADAVMDGDAAGGVLAGTYPNPSFASDMATQAELDAHLNDVTDAHDASAISVDSTNLAGVGTDVQTVLEELDDAIAAGGIPATIVDAKGDLIAATAADTVTRLPVSVTDGHVLTVDAAEATGLKWAAPAGGAPSGPAGGVLSGTYPNPGFASDMATQAELDAHITDISDAHDASAISVDSTTLVGVGTDVQAVFEELDNAIADHLADAADAHDASAISVLDTAAQFTGTDVEAVLAEIQDNLDAHLADAADAHDASAISILDTAGDFTATDVEGALAELQADNEARERVVQIGVTDPAGSAITTGDGKAYLLITDDLNGMNLVDADAAVTTVSSSGTPTIQIRNVTQAADMLTTKITIDANENTSYTAATAPVIDSANDDVATGDLIAVDIDVAGTGAKGLIVALTFQTP